MIGGCGKENMNKLSKKLNPIELGRIIGLFEEKGWKIDENNKNSLYNRYLNRYVSLKTKEEKDFFISISKRYQVIDLNQYHKLLVDILNTIFKTTKKKEILVFPLLSKNDISKIKSSTFMCYLFNHVSINYYDNLAKKAFTVIEDYKMLNKKFRDGKYLLLVDDYIGSGNQCINALDDIIYDIDIEMASHIYIISLYINEKGIETITEKIKGYENISLVYGASTEYVLAEDKHILKSIDIVDKDKNYMGYKNCGDLITLIRTPNNTIPLFRHRKNAPFPRNIK